MFLISNAHLIGNGGYVSRVMHIFTGNVHPHREWGCVSREMYILTRGEDVPRLERQCASLVISGIFKEIAEEHMSIDFLSRFEYLNHKV